jgi:hypothetical protein
MACAIAMHHRAAVKPASASRGDNRMKNHAPATEETTVTLTSRLVSVVGIVGRHGGFTPAALLCRSRLSRNIILNHSRLNRKQPYVEPHTSAYASALDSIPHRSGRRPRRRPRRLPRHYRHCSSPYCSASCIHLLAIHRLMCQVELTSTATEPKVRPKKDSSVFCSSAAW